jgi:hypothetical protein
MDVDVADLPATPVGGMAVGMDDNVTVGTVVLRASEMVWAGSII